MMQKTDKTVNVITKKVTNNSFRNTSRKIKNQSNKKSSPKIVWAKRAHARLSATSGNDIHANVYNLPHEKKMLRKSRCAIVSG